MGIEPTPSAWKAEVLPLNYTRLTLSIAADTQTVPPIPGRKTKTYPRRISHWWLYVVEGAGFEPAKAEPSDLQSDPVDRLGTPPKKG